MQSDFQFQTLTNCKAVSYISFYVKKTPFLPRYGFLSYNEILQSIPS